MATTAVFDLISALVDIAEASLTDVTVLDGQGSEMPAGDFLMIGVGDPTDNGPAFSAEGSQEWAGLGARAANEEGSVTCCATVQSGDSGNAAQRAVRDRLRDLLATLEAELKADPSLGGVLPGPGWARFGKNTNLTQISGTDGVAVVFYFEIAYQARL
jgi:hypothetical protein